MVKLEFPLIESCKDFFDSLYGGILDKPHAHKLFYKILEIREFWKSRNFRVSLSIRIHDYALL